MPELPNRSVTATSRFSSLKTKHLPSGTPKSPALGCYLQVRRRRLCLTAHFATSTRSPQPISTSVGTPPTSHSPPSSPPNTKRRKRTREILVRAVLLTQTPSITYPTITGEHLAYIIFSYAFKVGLIIDKNHLKYTPEPKILGPFSALSPSQARSPTLQHIKLRKQTQEMCGQSLFITPNGSVT